MLGYLITIPIMALLLLEVFLFVRIIARFRHRYVPLLTLLTIFVLNFGLCYALLYLPTGKVVTPPPPAPVSAPIQAPSK